MELGNLQPAVKKVTRRRVGRGIGSGLGKTSGKGHKGQKARSGGGVRRGFEGGQTPLYRRLPKRGFTNIHAKNYTEVTLTMLNKSTSEEVTAESLIADGIISKSNDGIVILATGKLDKKLTVNFFSRLPVPITTIPSLILLIIPSASKLSAVTSSDLALFNIVNVTSV